ncbi:MULTISPECIES: hypothetical protein [unclassified Paracoccus (in: a-proteobacteria)]|uniref:hypothetical protein n=1 Tax=unclassified Paracoccus (in: a-proteobacteria) TaxID=2688777 RepID=UPI000A0BEF37|nr:MULTISPECIES: hypothetical protein [unclassified Paracoccus (in: a-proteobacteria)]SMG34845.1 hypothetical protein SAMN02746000_02083 [Paracoccus sp. J56]
MTTMTATRGRLMLAGNHLDLREKTSGLAGLRRVGSDAAGLRSEAKFIIGAQRHAAGRKCRKPPGFGPWCRPKPCKAKALRHDATRGVQNQGAASAAPKQCADKGLPRNRRRTVPVSFILPS